MKQKLLKGLKGASNGAKAAIGVGTVGTAVVVGTVYQTLAGTPETEPKKDDIISNETIDEPVVDVEDTKNDEVNPSETTTVVYENDAMKQAKEQLKDQAKKPDEDKTEDKEDGEDEKVEEPDLSLINAKKEVASIIAEFLNSSKNDFTENSYEEMSAIVLEATKMLENKDITLDEILEHIEKLKETKTELVETKELKTEIVFAQTEVSKAYTEASKQKLLRVMEEATAIATKKDATKEDVARSLRMIRSVMLEMEADKTELSKVIFKSRDIVESDWSVSSFSTFNDALKIANKVMEEKTASVEEVEKATKDLTISIEKLSVDTTSLERTLKTAKSLNTDDYTDEILETISNKITEVETFLQEEHKQSEINEMEKELISFIDEKLEGSLFDKTELKETLNMVQTLKEDVYTPNSWNVFNSKKTDVINKAIDVISRKKATFEEIESSKKALHDLTTLLTERANVSVLKNAIANISNLTENDYTPNSWNALMNKVKQANDIVKDLNTTQQNVDAIIIELKDTKDALLVRADVSSLKEMIKDLDVLVESDYTLVTWVNLVNQKVLSENIVKDLNATQEEVNNSLNELAKAITNLSADTTILQKVVDTAKQETEKAYTTETVDVLKEAIKNAETIILKDHVSLKEVTDAKTSINDAISLLKVDTTELTTVLQELKGYELKDYTDESFEVLTIAIAKAEGILNQPTLENVANMISELNDAKAQLQAFVPANLTDIKETVGKAELIIEGDFSSESFSLLQTALSKAKHVITNDRAKQEEVDVANNDLNTALSNLAIDKTKLETIIEETKNFVASDYKSGYEEFKIEWDKASALLLEETVKQSAIDSQLTLLQEKIDLLVVVGEADKEELKVLLGQIDALTETDYTPNSWDALQLVKTKALDIVNNIKAPQTQVDSVTNELLTAKTNLVVRANKVALVEELKVIDALTETDYTPNSWEMLISEKEKAQLIIDNLNATQEEVDTVKTNLTTAKTNLVLKANTQSLEELLIIASNSLKENYTQETKDTVQSIIDKATLLKADANVSQKAIDDVVIELNSAIAKLSADITELKEIVKNAELELVKAWSTETKQSLENAINNAKAIMEKETISLGEVRTVKVNIENNIKNLIADTSNLEIAIATAKRLKLDNYTDASFNALQEVIAKVELVVQNPTIETVEGATNELANAIGNLQVFVPANMETLGQTIVVAENIVETDYSFASYNNLKTVLERAKETVLTNRVSQEEVDSMNLELQTAINDLTVDKTELQTLVDSSSSYKVEDYKSGFEEFKTAWDNASSLLTNTNAKQSEVDSAVTVLSSKIDALVLYNNANKTELINIMNVVKALKESDYTTSSWASLTAEITKAQIVLDNRDATQSEVSNAVLGLTNAKNSLVQKADLTTIKETLVDAESKVSGNYTVETLGVLNQAITNAKTVINNPNATQNEVDTATQNLRNAISGLKIFVDTTNLETKLAQAKALNSKDYSVETYAKLQTAITHAENVLRNTNATQTEVDNATNLVTTAMNELKEVETVASKRKECEQLIAQGKELLNDFMIQAPDQYGKDLADELSFVERALARFTDDQFTIAEIQNYMNNITTAMKAYKDNAYDMEALILKCQMKIAEVRSMDLSGYTDNSVLSVNHFANLLEDAIAEGQSYIYIESAYGWLLEEIDKLTADVDTTVYVNQEAPGEVLALLNAERKKLGLGELTMDAKLCEATTIRATEAKDQTGLFSEWAHKRPDGRKWNTVLDEINYHQSFAGENAASGYANGSSLYNGWLGSEGHRKNMLTPEFTKVGISMIKVGNGQWISYMILAK